MWCERARKAAWIFFRNGLSIFYKMFFSTYQVGVVGGRRVGDGPLASCVEVAQVEGEALGVVGAQVVVVPKLVVAGGLGRALIIVN